jgi:hypothetical protein
MLLPVMLLLALYKLKLLFSVQEVPGGWTAIDFASPKAHPAVETYWYQPYYLHPSVDRSAKNTGLECASQGCVSPGGVTVRAMPTLDFIWSMRKGSDSDYHSCRKVALVPGEGVPFAAVEDFRNWVDATLLNTSRIQAKCPRYAPARSRQKGYNSTMDDFIESSFRSVTTTFRSTQELETWVMSDAYDTARTPSCRSEALGDTSRACSTKCDTACSIFGAKCKPEVKFAIVFDTIPVGEYNTSHLEPPSPGNAGNWSYSIRINSTQNGQVSTGAPVGISKGGGSMLLMLTLSTFQHWL